MRKLKAVCTYMMVFGIDSVNQNKSASKQSLLKSVFLLHGFMLN